jgi:hypothetical protein
MSSPPVDRKDVEQLSLMGVRYVLIHQNLLSPSQSMGLQNQLDELNMVPVLTTSQHLIYKIEAPIENP